MDDLKLPIACQLTEHEQTIFDLIRRAQGQEEAVSKRALMDAVGLPERVTRKLVRHLIDKHGVPVCSCSRGYYLPTTAEELLGHFRFLRSNGISYLVRAAQIKKISLAELLGQLRLEFS